MARVSSYKRKRGSKKKQPRMQRRRGRVVTRRPRRMALYRGVRTPFPETKLVRHRYCDVVELPAKAAGVGGLSSYTFCMNDMYDPDYSGIGHQPLYRDEMAARYGKYTVIASYIRVTFGQFNQEQCRYGIVATASSDPMPGSNPSRSLVEEYGYGSKISAISAPHVPSQRTYPLVLRNSYDAKRWYKTTLKGILADDAKVTNVGLSPNERLFYYIFREQLDPTPAAMDAENIEVEISYICMWRDPKDVVPS